MKISNNLFFSVHIFDFLYEFSTMAYLYLQQIQVTFGCSNEDFSAFRRMNVQTVCASCCTKTCYMRQQTRLQVNLTLSR